MDFKFYLDKVGEIGYIAEITHSIVYVSGIPHVRPTELVMFESGEIGQVLSLGKELAEVLVLTATSLRVGTRVARTGESFTVPLSTSLLGRTINPLGNILGSAQTLAGDVERRPIDTTPMGIVGREDVKESFETGVTIVDLIVPLGKGQRELIIGDRKTGKTAFLMQVLQNQASRGVVCIYAAIAKRQLEIKKFIDLINGKGISKSIITVVSGSGDPAGLIYLTPYTAMTVAEYFRDQGKDVLIILDDLTAHAKYYREITLLARRFPGRSSYPGDIFYTHSRLMERAGNFDKGSITCLPVAESVLGDLSGYIQTNIMAMTDGHIFLDVDLFNQGRRPAVNPFLSVTRVGLQAQSPLIRDLNRQLTAFLTKLERMRQFMHFGAEVSKSVQETLQLGTKINAFFNQQPNTTVPVNIGIYILGVLWSGAWNEIGVKDVREKSEQIISSYMKDPSFREKVDTIIMASPSFKALVESIEKAEAVAK
ncbi:hypothetical protein A2801_03085 [Candidatus Woesebacteria bacterium RIFCSPHIGHO2_01_FULL_41_10]|uniref:ATPase F1/V1/A1 complex alpha/beta subunit nucleotide-binding domain-containing protein n=1 Tax=Candidatus Woesebacteria bacterium RIFCSPHIGHO2_01_FULL_41_10 TaxID=1802500 RepID=A0A1F7YLB5_9BACT|nr:MAG: hypothetical protein A2801_03085 [Candidatus Woesebacteria bacterium RIFCSPHIGHO2_01_FULL_41_10]